MTQWVEHVAVKADYLYQFSTRRVLFCDTGTVFRLRPACFSQLMGVTLESRGGFSRGQKMPRDVDEVTRYELFGYITALAAVLLRCAPRPPHEADSIVAFLETLVFLPACRTHALHMADMSIAFNTPVFYLFGHSRPSLERK